MVMPRVVALSFAGLLAISTLTVAKNRENEVSADEYAIYSLVIDRVYVEKKNPSLIVIAKQTESGAKPEPGKGPIIGVANPTEMIDALKSIADLTPPYQARNTEPVKLKEHFNLPVDYVLVDKEKALGLISKDAGQMDRFSKKYPGSEHVGLVGLSRIGFNADSTRALVYAAHWCGTHCGDSLFVVLVKNAGQWKIRYETIASAS